MGRTATNSDVVRMRAADKMGARILARRFGLTEPSTPVVSLPNCADEISNCAAPASASLEISLPRGPLGMMPTPRAEQLAIPVRAAMDGLQEALEPDEFEPGKATQSFKIAVDNYAAIVLIAPIAAKIAELAPGVRLDFRPSGTLNVLDLLDRSELHLAVVPSDVTAERFTRKRLIQDEFVLVMRRDHPLSTDLARIRRSRRS